MNIFELLSRSFKTYCPLLSFNTLHYFIYIHCVSLCNTLLHLMKPKCLYYDSWTTCHVAPPAIVKVCMKEDLNKLVDEGAGSGRDVTAASYRLQRLPLDRVSTNLTEQISRRFQEGFQEKSRTCLHFFGLLCNVPNLLVCLNIEQKHDMHNMGAVAKITRKPCCRRESARCRCNFRSIDRDMINKDQWRTDFKLRYVTYLLNL